MSRFFSMIAVLMLCACFVPENLWAAVGTNGYRTTHTLSTTSVTCAATATSISTANAARRSFAIENSSGTTVYIGNVSDVTTANGFKLNTGQSISDEGLHPYIGTLGCIVSSGTAVITFIEKTW